MDKSISNQIKELICYLNARTKEYDAGHPTISDKEWDDKYFELQQLENDSHIIFNDSPTQSISFNVVNSLEKVVHNHDMLSLDKTKSKQEVMAFLGDKFYLAMCKMDGLTCSLIYENGKLIAAETRGNGKVGENILHNAMVIPSIPKEVPILERLVVDGEIICTTSNFENFKDLYKNPRNFASGSIRLLNSVECAERKLTFVAWDVIEGFSELKTLSGRFMKLIDSGFEVVPYVALVHEEGIQGDINLIKDAAEVNNYPIDGVVFKFDDIDYGKSLGQTAHHFKNAIAYKFYDETYSTELIDIEWTMGRTGVLTPIAVFTPVDIDGSTISKASLHNVSIMEEILGVPYRGQKLEIYKANMIIPQVYSAEKQTFLNNESCNFIKIPVICPICKKQTEIIKNNNTKILTCSNPDCEGKLINKLDHFCGKKGLDIKGLSKATLGKLMDWEWVSKYEDLFILRNHAQEWKDKIGFGEKSVEKILTSIEDGSKCELSSFIAAIGIPLIGIAASKELVKYFKTWPDFINAVEEKYHFWEIPNFGIEMHNAIINFNYEEAKNLYNNYLSIQVPIEEEKYKNTLEDLSIVITGKLNHFKNRDEIKTIIEAHGGKVVGSISGKTSYLINNDINSTSSKNTSAKKFGIPILSEEEFIKMFNL